MRFSSLDLKTTIEKERLLATLLKNTTAHKQIVKEARVGFVKQAEETLAARLDEIRKGRVVDLVFHLKPPKDHTDEYETVIKMVTMGTAREIELTATEFRNFVEDEWDWSQDFYACNKGYSQIAATISEGKGY